MSNQTARFGPVRTTAIHGDGEPVRFQREPDGSIVVSTVIPPTSNEYTLWDSLERAACRIAAQGASAQE